jgi:MtN3 and saliva related transmembrane protein
MQTDVQYKKIRIFQLNLNTLQNTVNRRNTMDTIMIIELIAAALTTSALFPQLIQVWKTKSTNDISTGMFTLTSTGVFVWFIYGVFVDNFPIIIANSLAFIQAITILFLKIKYK